MSITYPLTLPLDGVFWTTDFDLLYRQEQSRTQAGVTYVKDFGQPLWRATWQSISLSPNQLDAWRARLKALEGGLKQFVAYPASRCYPIAYPNGKNLASQNLLLWTEQFDNAYWIKPNSSIVSNAALAPDGTMTMDKLVDSTSNPAHGCVRSFSYLLGETYTLSVYAKAGEYSKLRINAPFDSGLGLANFDLAAKTASVLNGAGAIARIEDVGAGALRCSLTITATNTNTQNVGFYLINNAGNISFVGTGSSGLYLWGAQLEKGSLSPYRKNEGTIFDGTNATIAAIGSNKDTITLANMPAGYTYSVGDYIQLATNNLHQVVDVDSGTLSVRPHIWPAQDTGDTVKVTKPSCLMTIVPGSIGTTADLATGRGTISFQGIESR